MGVGVAELGEQLLARWPDPADPGWAEVAAVAATAYVVIGAPERGTDLGQQALDASPSPLAAVIAQRALFLAGLATVAGEPALHQVEDAIAQARRHNLLPWRIELESFRAITLAGLGHDDALPAARAAHQEAVATGSPILAAWSGLVHGHLLASRDDDAPVRSWRTRWPPRRPIP